MADQRIAHPEAVHRQGLTEAIDARDRLGQQEAIRVRVADAQAQGGEGGAEDLRDVALRGVAAAAGEHAGDVADGAEVAAEGRAHVTPHHEVGREDGRIVEGDRAAVVAHQLTAVGHAELTDAPVGDPEEAAGGVHVEQGEVGVAGVDVLTAQRELAEEAVLAEGRIDRQAGVLLEQEDPPLAAVGLLLQHLGKAHGVEAAANLHLRLLGDLRLARGAEAGDDGGRQERRQGYETVRHGHFSLFRPPRAALYEA
ncbi:hypothetical protein D3C86_1249470 [compost metagenome]